MGTKHPTSDSSTTLYSSWKEKRLGASPQLCERYASTVSYYIWIFWSQNGLTTKSTFCMFITSNNREKIVLHWCEIRFLTGDIYSKLLIYVLFVCKTGYIQLTNQRCIFLPRWLRLRKAIFLAELSLPSHMLGQKKKIVMLPSPDQNLKIGSVGRDFFFFFFYVPWESWVFQYFF